MLSRRKFVGAALGAAALGLAGCSQGQPSNDQGSSSAAESSAEQQAAPVLSAVLAATAETLTSPDAFFAVDPTCQMLRRHVFEGLYEVDPHTGKVANALAEGAPDQVNATTFDVALREGAAFSDGTPVTAEHVASAWAEAIASSNVYATLLAPIATVAARDARTVRVTLAADEPAFLQQRLALIKVGLAAEGAPGARIGSGPWAATAELPADLQACLPTAEAVEAANSELDAEGADQAETSPSACKATAALPAANFLPNPSFTGSDAPAAEAMTWLFAPDDAERLSAFACGCALACADAAAENSAVLEDRETTLEWVPGTLSPFLLFNCAKPPFDNPAVRQAALFAIDYDRIASQCFDGHAEVPTSCLPVTHANYHRTQTVYSHDVTRAKHLLEQAEFTSDEAQPFSLAVCGENLAPLAELVAEGLTQAGIATALELVDEAALAERSTIFDLALCADDPTLLGPCADLALTWRYGGNIQPESFANWQSSAAFAAVQENLALARATTDATQQQKLWNECFDLIAEAAPLHPLCFVEVPTAWNSARLTNFSPLGTGCIDFLDVSLK